MKQKIISIILASVLLVTVFQFAVAEDYSYLDDMSINQLKALYAEIQKRLPQESQIIETKGVVDKSICGQYLDIDKGRTTVVLNEDGSGSFSVMRSNGIQQRNFTWSVIDDYLAIEGSSYRSTGGTFTSQPVTSDKFRIYKDGEYIRFVSQADNKEWIPISYDDVEVIDELGNRTSGWEMYIHSIDDSINFYRDVPMHTIEIISNITDITSPTYKTQSVEGLANQSKHYKYERLVTLKGGWKVLVYYSSLADLSGLKAGDRVHVKGIFLGREWAGTDFVLALSHQQYPDHLMEKVE